MSKTTKSAVTYKQDREPRTRKQKLEDVFVRENRIPSKAHLDSLLSDVDTYLEDSYVPDTKD